MAGGGGELGKGSEELGEAAGDPEKGGRHKTGVGKFFQGSSAAGAAVWGGYVGGVPDDGEVAERIPPWGGEKTRR